MSRMLLFAKNKHVNGMMKIKIMEKCEATDRHNTVVEKIDLE